MDGHIRGVEAVTSEIMAKHRLLRQMSDFRPILDDEVEFSRLSTSNQVNHLHHDPPMDLAERLNRYFWGVEALSHKITAENHIFCRFSVLTPIAADFVLS